MAAAINRCEIRRRSKSAERVRISVSLLKIGIDGDSVTAGGRLFHTRAAAAGNARSPIVECRILGTTSAVVDADRSRHLESKSVTRLELSRAIRWSETVLAAKSQDR